MALPSSRQLVSSLIKAGSPDSRDILLTLHALFPTALLPALDLLDRGLVTRLHLDSDQKPGSEPQVHSNQIDEQASDFYIPASQYSTAQAALNTHTAASRARQPRVDPKANETTTPLPETDANQKPSAFPHPLALYLVRSAQTHLTRSFTSTSSNHSQTTYEVRLEAWNCSCAAFAFAAFPASAKVSGSDLPDKYLSVEFFGGLGAGMPVCKHLLACVLAERGNGFARFVEEREASVEEIAGWAAGWGD